MNIKHTWSLQTRMILIVVSGTLLGLATVAYTAFWVLLDDFEELLIERQFIETQTIAREVDWALERRVSALENFAESLNVVDSLPDQATLQQEISSNRRLQALFPAGVLVFDELATAVVENLPVEGRLGTNYADRPHFQKALKQQKSVVSAPIIGRTTGLPLLSFLSPIMDTNGHLIGLIGGTLNLAEASLVPRGYTANQSGDTRIIDTNNLLYVDGDSESMSLVPLPEVGQSPLVDKVMSGFRSGVVTDEEKLIYAASKTRDLNWVVVRTLPYQQALQSVWRSLVELASTSVLVIVFVGAVAFLLARYGMSSLNKVTLRIEALTKEKDVFSGLPESGAPEVAALARAFNRLSHERKQLYELQSHFISTVSHELRTPLTSIQGSIKLVQGGVLGELAPKQKELLGVALRNGERLEYLVNDLLDFSKLSEGKIDFQYQCCDVASLLQDVLSNNQPMAGHYRVSLQLQCSEPLQVWADANRLTQVLSNLVSNAIKFSPPGGVVTLRCFRTPENQIRLMVSDQGDGVPEAFAPHIFERFSQAQKGDARENKGTGLGLAISRELVLQMGGQIGFFNDEGAHFWCELPEPQAHNRRNVA